MSNYTTQATRLQACASTLKAALPGLERLQQDLVEGLSSAGIAEVSETLATFPATSVDELSHAWSGMQQALPPWDHLPPAAQDALAEASAGLEHLHEVQPSSRGSFVGTELRDVSALMFHALDSASKAVASLERGVIAESAAVSLPALGYDISRIDEQSVTAIEAHRGHETLLMVISNGGEVSLDYAGLSDGSCQTSQEEVLNSMASQGIEFSETAHVRHGDPRGGGMIAEAASIRATSLAAGAVVAHGRRQSSAIRQLRVQTSAGPGRTVRADQ